MMKLLLFLTFFAFTISCSSDSKEQTEVITAQTETNKDDTTKKETETAPKAGYEVGDMAEPFELKNIDGKNVSLANYTENKGVVVIFTCNHCPFSVAYEDRIIELNTKFTEMGYPVVAVNPNDPEVQPEDSFDKMVVRAEEKKFNFPYLFDETQEVFKKFGATKTPHVYVLSNNENGMKVDYIGAIDDNADPDKVNSKFLEDAIKALSEGKQPEPAFTKAFGCSIKVKKTSQS